MPNTTEDGPWYHGSAAELQPGDLILPSGTTGLWRENMLSKDAQSVYFTSLFGLALRYALRRAEQWRTVAKVYRVEPEGPRTPDAVNVDPPVSFYCCSARVLQVYGPEDPLYAKYIGGIAAERMCRSLTGITEALDGGTEKPSFLDLLSEIVAGGRRELQTRKCGRRMPPWSPQGKPQAGVQRRLRIRPNVSAIWRNVSTSVNGHSNPTPCELARHLNIR